MKQRISVDDLNQLTDQQKEKLRKLCLKWFEDHTIVSDLEGNAYPNIGQMIEIIQSIYTGMYDWDLKFGWGFEGNGIASETWEQQLHIRLQVVEDGKIKWLHFGRRGQELANALWEAVKSIL